MAAAVLASTTVFSIHVAWRMVRLTRRAARELSAGAWGDEDPGAGGPDEPPA